MPEVLNNGLALFFAWLFAVAALYKFRAPRYYQLLLTSHMPGLPFKRSIPVMLGISELLIAILVLWQPTRAAALTGAAVLLLTYAATMSWQLRNGHADAACGCSGPGSELLVSPALVARNLVCVALALLSMTAAPGPGTGFLSAVLSLLVALVLISGYLLSERLIGNAQFMNQDV